MAIRYANGGFDGETIRQEYTPYGKYLKNAGKAVLAAAAVAGFCYLFNNAVIEPYKRQNAKAEQIIQSGDRASASRLLADTLAERTRDPIATISADNERKLARLVKDSK